MNGKNNRLKNIFFNGLKFQDHTRTHHIR